MHPSPRLGTPGAHGRVPGSRASGGPAVCARRPQAGLQVALGPERTRVLALGRERRPRAAWACVRGRACAPCTRQRCRRAPASHALVERKWEEEEARKLSFSEHLLWARDSACVSSRHPRHVGRASGPHCAEKATRREPVPGSPQGNSRGRNERMKERSGGGVTGPRDPAPARHPAASQERGRDGPGRCPVSGKWRGVDVLGSVCGVSGGKVAVSGDRADVSGGAHPAAASARCAPSGESGDPSPPSISLLCPRA